MRQIFENPEYKKMAFTCPSCSVYSKHDWVSESVNETSGHFTGRILYGSKEVINELSICKCQNCGYISFWYKKELAWPLITNVEPALEEMPDDIKNLYNEARSIVQLSPKGSCAILRLALQKLCNRLVEHDENEDINNAIKELVVRGLPPTLQEAMDTVRIVGNEAVHPGEINLDDNKQLAYAMFRLINIIIEKMLVEPKEIKELYYLMPKSKLQGIENRDKKTVKKS